MNDRLHRLREELDRQDLDALLVSKASNIRYLCGATGTACELIVGRDDALLLSSFVDLTENAETACGMRQQRRQRRPHDPAETAAAVGGWGLRRIGLEAHVLPQATFTEYENALDGIEVVPTTGIVERQRWIKDEEEIGLIQRGMAVNDLGCQYVRDHAREGMTEFELGVGLEHAMRAAGADDLGFLIVQFGPNAAKPHHRFSQRRLRRGDFILIDIGAIHQPYVSDTTRTFVFGEPDERQRTVYETVRRAQEAALATVRAGVSAAAVDEAARSVITAAGFGEYFGHGVGHGINEGPTLAPGSDHVLAAGNVVTIEPGIYIADWGGVRIEDSVVVTAGGYHNLARFPKELTVIQP